MTLKPVEDWAMFHQEGVDVSGDACQTHDLYHNCPDEGAVFDYDSHCIKCTGELGGYHEPPHVYQESRMTFEDFFQKVYDCNWGCGCCGGSEEKIKEELRKIWDELT